MALVPDRIPQINDQIDILKYNQKLIKDFLLNFQNEYSNESEPKSQSKNEPSILIKKENESETVDNNTLINESKPMTRQLRSSRLTAQKDEPSIQNSSKSDKQFEINFILANKFKHSELNLGMPIHDILILVSYYYFFRNYLS